MVCVTLGGWLEAIREVPCNYPARPSPAAPVGPVHRHLMGRRRLVRALLVSSLIQDTALVARAQSPDLVTDRPDRTESASVVPRGLTQAETGYLFAHDEHAGRHEAPGTLVRVGLGGRTELRVGHAGFITSDGRSGLGDTEIGAKVNLSARAHGWWPELAVLGHLSLPTGSDRFSSSRVDPSFLASVAHELSSRLSLGYNAGMAWESSPDQPERNRSITYSVSFGSGLTERLSGFVEIFGDRNATDQAPTAAVAVDGGLTFLVTRTLQVDVSVGRGLREPTADVFVGAGVSFRLPH